MNTPRHLHPTKLTQFLFGVPYYPEHWTADERATDPAMMAKAGVNVVRMGEFAWSIIEPQEGKFDFSLFDETIESLKKFGIKTIFCTPTATPPAWLTTQFPDWMRIDENGNRMPHGNRQHVCTTNEEFRAHSRRITEIMAEHYRNNENVIGWQTDNELNNAMNLCYCRACVQAFRDWLCRKYTTIAELNRAWGTIFWSQVYDSFDQIPLPYTGLRPAAPNQSHLLDFYRFVSDTAIEFQRQQVEILRQKNPTWWITHNGLFAHTDYWQFTEDLDFLGVDVYPAGNYAVAEQYLHAAILLEQCRCASGGFIVPEQQGGYGSWHIFTHYAVPPGRMRMWAYQSIAHGADGIMHFRWRTCRYGAEIYWHGILDHDNIPRRRFDEFCQEGSELKNISPKILGTIRDIRAAILFETEQHDAHDTITRQLTSPQQQTNVAYEALSAKHLPAGLVHVRDEFDGLKLIIWPSLPLIDKTVANKLTAFVQNGGVLLLTARSAIRDRDNQVPAVSLPYLLSELCGMTIEEYGMIPENIMRMKLNDVYIDSGSFYEILKPSSAKIAAMWHNVSQDEHNAAEGNAAVTHAQFGKGHVLYIGTFLSDKNVGSIIDYAVSLTDIKPFASCEPAIEITVRKNSSRRLMFVINHYPKPQQITELPHGNELLSEQPVSGTLTLPPYGVRNN